MEVGGEGEGCGPEKNENQTLGHGVFVEVDDPVIDEK